MRRTRLTKRKQGGTPINKATPIISLGLALLLFAGCSQGDAGRAQAATGASAAVIAQGMGPRAVLAAIEAATRECRAHGGRFVAGAGFDTRLALNGDDAPDHVLNYRAAQCEGADNAYSGGAPGAVQDDGCGRNGCRVEVFLSSPSGHQRVFGAAVWAVGFVRDTMPARLRFSASGMPGCDASYAEGCHAEWGWNGSAFVHQRWLSREDVDAFVQQDGADPAVDESGYAAQASGGGVSGDLPFREGHYVAGSSYQLDRGNGPEEAYERGIVISADEIHQYEMPDQDQYRILDRLIDGPQASLTFQCLIYCGNGADYCPEEYAPQRFVAIVRAIGSDRISVRLEGREYHHWNGEYAYHGPARP